MNRAFEEAADSRFKGILRYTIDPIVSRDIIGDPSSCVFDSGPTKANGRLAKTGSSSICAISSTGVATRKSRDARNTALTSRQCLGVLFLAQVGHPTLSP